MIVTSRAYGGAISTEESKISLAIPSTPSRCIWQYTDLLKSKKVEVWFSEKEGFTGRVYELAKNGDLLNMHKDLPLIGINSSILKERNLNKMFSYLVGTHFIPEKGLNGIVNRIAVHLSAKGGIKSAIPFQPGLAMGTIVRGDIIDKMDKYAEAMAKVEAFEEQIRGAEQKIEFYETKIKSRVTQKNLKYPDDDSKDVLVKFWNDEIKRLTALIASLAKQFPDTGEIPIFTGFQQGIITPIDRGATQVEILPLGFDSLTFSSEYILKSENNSEIHNRMSQSSSSNSMSASGGWGIWSAGVSHSRAEAVAKRVADIKKEDIVEGVLVINATATTRHVRCFKEIKYDLSKLQKILSVMEKENSAEIERYGITITEKDMSIYLLTEAVLGGSFTALVTFLDTSKMTRNINDNESKSSQSTSASVGGGLFFIRARADYANASSNASKQEDDVLRNIAQTRVRIEFIAQGALPTFERHTIEREVFKHLNLNPSNFELSPQDISEVEQMMKAKGQDKEVAVVKSAMKLQNSQAAFLNTYRGLASGKEKANLHTMESVMGAYENFAEQMTQDNECGVPVGFYYQVLTKSDIKNEIKKMQGKNEQKIEDKDENEKIENNISDKITKKKVNGNDKL